MNAPTEGIATACPFAAICNPQGRSCPGTAALRQCGVDKLQARRVERVESRGHFVPVLAERMEARPRV